MVESARIGIPDGYIYLCDPSHAVEMPYDTEITPVVATASCVVVRTIYEVEGTCAVHLGAAIEKPARVLAFEGELETPGRSVELCDSEGRLVFALAVPNARARITVWTNDRQFPTEVFVQAA
jgi:hypothetical protein